MTTPSPLPNRTRLRRQRPALKLRTILPLMERAVALKYGQAFSHAGHKRWSTMELIARLALETGIPARTILAWWCDYKRAGFAGLVTPPRADRGHSRFFAAHPEVAAIVQQHVKARRSATAIHQTLERWMGSSAPSLCALRLYVRSLRRPQ